MGTGGTLEDSKLFVGGLGWDTTERQIRDYFSKFGTVESINVKTNPNTGRSRGFAFVVYTNKESVDEVMNHREHIVNGKKIDPKPAMARTGKLFVGGVKPDITDEEVKNHFSQFGSILDMEVPYNKQLNQRRGFCFITFEHEQVVNELMKNPQQIINGHKLDLRRAQPKVDYPPGSTPMRGFYAGRGGGGGGSYSRGGRGGFYGAAGAGAGSYGSSGYGGYGSGVGGGYEYPGGYDSYSSGYGGSAGAENYSGYGAEGGYNYSNGYGYNSLESTSAPGIALDSSYPEGASKRSGYRHQPY